MHALSSRLAAALLLAFTAIACDAEPEPVGRVEMARTTTGRVGDDGVLVRLAGVVGKWTVRWSAGVCSELEVSNRFVGDAPALSDLLAEAAAGMAEICVYTHVGNHWLRLAYERSGPPSTDTLSTAPRKSVTRLASASPIGPSGRALRCEDGEPPLPASRSTPREPATPARIHLAEVGARWSPTSGEVY